MTRRTAEALGETIDHPWNPWATYVDAREEARCRGDRRVGTEHLLVALLLETALANALATPVEAARAGLAELDRQALAAVGIGTDVEVPESPPARQTGPTRRPTLKTVLQGRLPLTPVAKRTLEATWKATKGRRRLGKKHLLASLLELERPDPAAELLAHLGIDPATARERLDRV